LTSIAQKLRQKAKNRKGATLLASKSKKGVVKAKEKEEEADENGKTKADKEQEEDDDDGPVTQLKRPLLPSKDVSQPQAKKARPAEKSSKKVEKAKSKKDSGLKKGAAMNHANVSSAVKDYMRNHPEWTLSLMKEEISEGFEWENGPKLKMFISTALKGLSAGSMRGGNVLEGIG